MAKLDALLKKLSDISELQAQVITGLHIERRSIPHLAVRMRTTISRIEAEEKAAWRTLALLSIGDNAIEDAAAEYADAEKRRIEKEDKARKALLDKARGSKQERAAGPPETQA